MSIQIKLVDSLDTIQKNINQAIASEMNRRIRKNTAKATKRLKDVIPTWIRTQPEMESILDAATPGSLGSQLGLKFGSAIGALDAIINSVNASIKIDFKPLNNKLIGGITFNCQPSDFLNLLALPQGHNLNYQESDLHWLDWLLTRGDTTIIVGYQYQPGQGDGRTGGGKMTEGTFWRIPPEYSGSQSDNFITRALSNREQELSILLSDILKD